MNFVILNFHSNLDGDPGVFDYTSGKGKDVVVAVIVEVSSDGQA